MAKYLSFWRWISGGQNTGHAIEMITLEAFVHSKIILSTEKKKFKKNSIVKKCEDLQKGPKRLFFFFLLVHTRLMVTPGASASRDLQFECLKTAK